MKKQKNTTISLDNLTIGYASKHNKKTIVSDITADIYSNELTCLLGSNGAGKSTLLRTLSAFQPQLSGDILVQGRNIKSYSEKKLSSLIAVVLTEKCDVKNMTTYELISLGRSPYTGFWGHLSKQDHEIINKVISQVGIENLALRMIHTLSDGERQKVMIAKALAQETPIIFLDEPTAFLDFPSKVEIMQLLHRLSREAQKTIFLSTHDLDLALQLADKIWLIDQQSGICIGTPEDLSLRGSLSNFFTRKGIKFDENTGLFRVDNDCQKQVRLIGHGRIYAMIRKALSRNGIVADRNVNSDIIISIQDDNKIHITSNSDQHPPIDINSIEELLDHILVYI